jgi:hypothetical protein
MPVCRRTLNGHVKLVGGIAGDAIGLRQRWTVDVSIACSSLGRFQLSRLKINLIVQSLNISHPYEYLRMFFFKARSQFTGESASIFFWRIALSTQNSIRPVERKCGCILQFMDAMVQGQSFDDYCAEDHHDTEVFEEDVVFFGQTSMCMYQSSRDLTILKHGRVIIYHCRYAASRYTRSAERSGSVQLDGGHRKV